MEISRDHLPVRSAAPPPPRHLRLIGSPPLSPLTVLSRFRRWLIEAVARAAREIPPVHGFPVAIAGIRLLRPTPRCAILRRPSSGRIWSGSLVGDVEL
ncbi:hypothetical protein OsJ_00354 [Oryza sativa Japonica Group]|uniref:Uncharacterized protein n=1 Tax=Oryza sativa subsp. japonica TaxID=39947 RepID=B9ESU8_ORYSJ|nr:hypothetical protein OsJ_00354 [Oryza sativa Japonica Group]